MLYNSFSFLLFFPIVATFFFLLPHRIRQGYLLVVSYFFYMNWSPTYSLFLVFVTLVSYVGAQILQKLCESENDKLRRVVLASTLLLCFSGLFIFKYLNFLNDSLWGGIFADRYSNGSATFRVIITSRYLFLHFSSVWIYDRCVQATDYGREEFLHICTVYLFFPANCSWSYWERQGVVATV